METPLKTWDPPASRASVITFLQKNYNQGKDGLSVGSTRYGEIPGNFG